MRLAHHIVTVLLGGVILLAIYFFIDCIRYGSAYRGGASVPGWTFVLIMIALIASAGYVALKVLIGHLNKDERHYVS